MPDPPVIDTHRWAEICLADWLAQHPFIPRPLGHNNSAAFDHNNSAEVHRHELVKEILRLQGDIQRFIDSLHAMHTTGTPDAGVCAECSKPWPCPTIKSLESKS